MGAAARQNFDRPDGAPDYSQIHGSAICELEAGVLRIVGDHVVLLEITQKLVKRNCRLRQEADIHAGAIGIRGIAIV